MRNKKLILLFKIGAFLLPVILCYFTFYYEGFLPLLTNSISFDAKYYAIKKRKLKQVELASVGSSMTLINLSSEVVTQYSCLSYYNFGSWNLQISDIDQLIKDFVLKYNPKTIMICSSIPDFTTAGNLNIPIELNAQNTFLPFYYLQNFNSCLEVIKRKKELDIDNNSNNIYTSLKFDENGGISLYIKKGDLSAELFNEKTPFPTAYSNSQYLALKNLSLFLKNNNIRIIFVQTPIKRFYLNDIAFKSSIRNHFDRCKSIIEAQGGIFLNANTKIFADSLFVDNLHLNGEGAKIFTKQIFEQIKLN